MSKAPLIYAGRRAQALSQDGFTLRSGAALEHDGSINPVNNGHFEVNLVGWAAYQNTAQATPVTGNGGSPTVTVTRTLTSPLTGHASGLITKDVVNRQGEGVRYALSVPSMFQSQNCKISVAFDASANYLGTGAEVLAVYLYDVTNAMLVTPATVAIPSGKGIFETTANLSATGVDYRLCIHVAGTGTSDWTMKIDQVKLTVDDAEIIVTPEGYTLLPGSHGILQANGEILESNGEFNYIKRGNGEIDATGWTVTGSAAIVRTTTGGEILRGVGSLKLTTGAAGNVVAYPFTVDLTDKFQLMALQFDSLGIGAYANGDFTINIRDVTNSTDIAPSLVSVVAANNKYQATFQFSATGTSYQLQFVSGATAGRQLVIDEVYLGPRLIPDNSVNFFSTDLLDASVTTVIGQTYTHPNTIVAAATPVLVVTGSSMFNLGSMTIQAGASVTVQPGGNLKII
jgi:hypothetical protein